MSIRSKLLVLLLLVSLIPLALMAAFSLHTTQRLGQHVGEHGRDAMTSRELRYLEEKLSDGVEIFRNHRALVEHLIREQAAHVEAALAREPGEAAWTPASAFDAGDVPTTQHARYARREAGGAATPLPISFAAVALIATPDSDLDALATDAARLSGMAGAYRDIHALEEARILWQYTSLTGGLHSAYPGHGGYPADFDPRSRQWYRDALEAEGPVWSLPLVNVSTRGIVTSVSHAVRRPDGRLAGVTGIDVAMPELFHVISDAQEDPAETVEAMIVRRSPSAGLVVHSRELRGDAQLAWNAPLARETIDDPEGALDTGFAEAQGRDEIGFHVHPHRGRDALWAFKSIRDDDLFLVITVPLGQVVERADAMQAFVGARFDEQSWIVAVGLVAIAALAAVVAHRVAGGVTRPLTALSGTASEIASGALESRADVGRSDEIGELAASINDMAGSIQKLVTAQEEEFFQALKAFMKALGTKDAYTAAHSGRVNRYSVMLGKRLGLDDSTLFELGRAALVHDLGKIGIPDRILNKPAPMDDDEYEVMKQHPGYSAAIMRPLKRFRALAEIAAWHHERWDGRGYPDGLAGEEIPLLVRIVAIADAWDAMTGDRIYRKGMSTEKALSILEAEVDEGQFDPELIRSFIQMVREASECEPDSLE